MADLTQQLLELKHLEKNKERFEELERRAVQAESYTKEAQVRDSKNIFFLGFRLLRDILIPSGLLH